MIIKIYFSEDYTLDESEGFYYRYITIKGIRIHSYGRYSDYEYSFNLTCCCSLEFSGLEPDTNLEGIYNVIGKWLNTDEATKSFEVSTLRCMYFESIFNKPKHEN